eukprot:TRINITY_DN27321_c0_g1_i1.p1 TRINITY_DN27321_c0_g1~~TRINITY_DN27321_c0_g1_i1.p1  ORF type:complete len:648 (-),score=99.13 TRINITY_DN27321_c0_g1_i1:303-2246(-)
MTPGGSIRGGLPPSSTNFGGSVTCCSGSCGAGCPSCRITPTGGSGSSANSGVAGTSRCVEVHATRPDQLCLLERLPEFRRSGRLCDVRLRSRDGAVFPAHRLVLALASEALAGLVGGAFAEGVRRPQSATGGCSGATTAQGQNCDDEAEVDLDISSSALEAVLEFIYVGSMRVQVASVCELLRFAHMYALDGLLSRAEEAVTERMNATACAEFLPESKLLGLESLEVACHQYALHHFEECVSTRAFGRWSAPLLLSLMQSDDLVVSSEEAVLCAIWLWHKAVPERGKETALLFSAVRFALLASPTVAALNARAQSLGPLGVELQSMLRRSLRRSGTLVGGSPSHTGRHSGASCTHGLGATGDLCLRRCFRYYWADFGCSLAGGTVVAGGGEGDEHQQIWGPFSLALVDGGCLGPIFGTGNSTGGGGGTGGTSTTSTTERALLIADKCTGRVVSWPLQDSGPPAATGKAVAGRGAAVNGVNDLGLFFKICLDSERRGLLVASCGEADGSSRVLRFHGGSGEPVEVPALEDTVRDVSAGPGGAIFILDNDGTRVLRRVEERVAGSSRSTPTVTVVAGSNGRGPEANQLSDAEYMVAAQDGSVYVSDKVIVVITTLLILRQTTACSAGTLVLQRVSPWLAATGQAQGCIS